MGTYGITERLREANEMDQALLAADAIEEELAGENRPMVLATLRHQYRMFRKGLK